MSKKADARAKISSTMAKISVGIGAGLLCDEIFVSLSSESVGKFNEMAFGMGFTLHFNRVWGGKVGRQGGG